MTQKHMTKIFIISFALISFLFSSLAYAENKKAVLDTLLDSVNSAEQRTAFDKIASSPEKYVPLVRKRLISISTGEIKPHMKTLDRLFYLTAFLKDQSLVQPIETLWLDADFHPDYCVYSCPMIFALTIYATSDLWTPPDTMSKTLDRHYDLFPEIRLASEISLDPTPEENRAHGPGIDKWLEEARTKSEQELIEQAGPNTKEFVKRQAAVFQLAYSVSSSENLKDLYLLAVQEGKTDVSLEFRRHMYMAIYRAERAKRLGK